MLKSACVSDAAKKLAGVANLSIKPRVPVAGVLVSLVVVAAILLMWRSATPPASSTAPLPPSRGGQLTAGLRSDPKSFNGLVSADESSVVVSSLLQSRLVRVNRSTFELEPGLAEKWEMSADGRQYTLHLRPDLTWSDGQPLTAADVTFTFQSVRDNRVESPLADSLVVGGQPIAVTAADDHTVVLTLAAPSGPGLRLLDAIPILPRHKLESALKAGTLRTAWQTTVAPADLVGSGPFVLSSYEPGQRVVLARNPHYWRKAPDGATLPYLDRLVLEVVPEQNAGMLRLEAGTLDMLQSELRPDDYVAARKAEEKGNLKLIELGVATDADAFWFCLKPEVKKNDRRFGFVQRKEFRQALSHAVDREEFARVVFFDQAVPIWGPITPGNKTWVTSRPLRYSPDIAKAKALLSGIGLEDRNGNGIVEAADGTEATFTVLTQRGVSSYDRGTTLLKERAAMIGIALNIVPMDVGAMVDKLLASDYDAIYMRVLQSDLDPGANLDLWLSSGGGHFWNLAQKTPATDWEKRIDTLMLEQASTVDPARRKALFNEVQQVFAENLPALYFAAPRLFYAYSTRVTGVVPSVLRPPALWNADSLGVTGPARAN
jgi:peptide/nickel transport system substrate-binding protein